MSATVSRVEKPASFWSLVSPGDRPLLFAAGGAVPLVASGVGVWRADKPVWGATSIAPGVMAVPAALKWRAGFRAYGFTAVLLSMLLIMQGFHTIEHFSQVIQYYVLDRPFPRACSRP